MTTPSSAADHPALPPSAQLIQMLFGKHVTYCIAAVAHLGVADHIGDTAVGVEELAKKVKANDLSLYRVMRALASVGIFAETTKRNFALTPMAETLKTDAPGSMRFMAMMTGDTWTSRPFEYITDTVRSGNSAMSAAFGKTVFELLQSSPEQAQTFNRAMTNLSAMETSSIVNGYDFSGIRQLADVGGGHGFLLSSILDHNPGMQGVLYDLASVVTDALAHPRITVESGSFFEKAPAGCDAYIMKHIIHDWDDDRCTQILKVIGEQLPANGKVLVCEMVVSENSAPEMVKMLDIEMLMLTDGGMERTESEFRELFAKAGLRLNRMVRTEGPMCVLEAVRA